MVAVKQNPAITQVVDIIKELSADEAERVEAENSITSILQRSSSQTKPEQSCQRPNVPPEKRSLKHTPSAARQYLSTSHAWEKHGNK